jgi:hypothetical protein
MCVSRREPQLFRGLVYELKGDTLPGAAGTLHLTLREPYGIVGRIIPFNHPLMFAVSRTAAALAAGNAVIVKPPEDESVVFACTRRDREENFSSWRLQYCHRGQGQLQVMRLCDILESNVLLLLVPSRPDAPSKRPRQKPR